MKYFQYLALVLISTIFFTLLTQGGVNPDGSFSQKIPIVIPPGTNGMQPNLSLVYNSNAGNGIMGIGWNLVGLPYITRDTRFPVEYQGKDQYLGSNGRLVKSGSFWHFEEETFSSSVLLDKT